MGVRARSALRGLLLVGGAFVVPVACAETVQHPSSSATSGSSSSSLAGASEVPSASPPETASAPSLSSASTAAAASASVSAKASASTSWIATKIPRNVMIVTAGPITTGTTKGTILPIGPYETPKAQLSDTTIEMAASVPSEVRAAVLKQGYRIRNCHVKVLASDSTFQGSLALEVAFDVSGKVARAAVIKASGKTALDACALSTTETMKSEPGAESIVEIRISYRIP